MSAPRFLPPASLRIRRHTLCIIGVALTLSACGYKGPLYMPPPPPPAPQESLTTPPSGPGTPSVSEQQTPPAPDAQTATDIDDTNSDTL